MSLLSPRTLTADGQSETSVVAFRLDGYQRVLRADRHWAHGVARTRAAVSIENTYVELVSNPAAADSFYASVNLKSSSHKDRVCPAVRPIEVDWRAW
jgi:hypothetical protein